MSRRALNHLCLLIAAFAACLPARSALAATLTVTSLTDSGAGTLRNQIAAATPGDTIDFSARGTITLTSGELVIAKNLIIKGPGASALTVNGNNASRIFNIQSGTVAISGLAISGGNSASSDGEDGANRGGGINNNGTLTVSNSTLSGNTAPSDGGSIYNNSGATLTVSNSTLSDSTANWGGGIYNNGGSLAVSSSTVSGNTADNGRGGGIYSGGIYDDSGLYNSSATLTVSNSTISGNKVNGSGGGIHNDATLTVLNSMISSNTANDGGGILNGGAWNTWSGGIWIGASLTVSRCTLSSNTVGDRGGGIYNDGSLTVSGSTLSGNIAQNGTGGGICSSYDGSLTVSSSTLSSNTAGSFGGGIYKAGNSTVALSSSIVAGNTASNAGPDVYGTAQSGGYNLVGKSDGSGGLTATGDQTGTSAAPLNAKLDSLKNNGGPTATHALLAGSPAINAGDPNFDGTDKTDQRGIGFVRVRAGRVDIGAFELQSEAPFATDVILSGTRGKAFNGQLKATAADTLSYSITSGTLPAGLSLNSATGVISGRPTATANGTTVNFIASYGSGVTTNEATATIYIYEAPGLIVTTDSDSSTAFDSLSSLREAVAYANTKPNANVTTPDAITFSGAFFNTAKTITLTGGELVINSDLTINGPGANLLTVSGNDASHVFNIEPGTVAVSGLTVSGGGIYNSGNLTVSSLTFSGNSSGSGIDNRATLMVSNSTFSGNTAGGIYNDGSLTVSKSTFSGNSSGSGGAIYNSGGIVTVSDSTIVGITRRSDEGGGIYNGGTLTLSNSTVSGYAATYGGGIYNNQVGTLVVSYSAISNCTGIGGGIYNRGTLTFSSSTLSNNTSYDDSGGIYNRGTLTVSNSTFSGNTAGYRGGGIYNHSGSLKMSNSTLTGNSARHIGGGVYNQGTLTLSNSTLTGNSTSFYDGGGIYNGGTLNLSGSIVAGNTAATSGPNIKGSVVSGGYNLVDKGDDSSGLTATGDQTGTSAAPLNAKLDSLKNNGGPTATHALLAGSPAINAGDPNFDGTDKTDQRGIGFVRVRAGRVDIGAFELQNDAPVATGPSSFIAAQNVAKTVTLTGTDADGDALTYIISSLPTRGAIYDGAGTTKLISTVPYELSGVSHQVTLLSSSLGTGTFGFKVNDGIASSTQQVVSYSVGDAAAPASVAVTTPANGSGLKTLTSISGNSADNTGGSGMSRVIVYLRRRNGSGALEYWANRSGTWGWGASVTTIPTILATTGVWSLSNTSPAETQLPSGTNLVDGSYVVQARAYDKAGNSLLSAANTFSVDNSAPATVVVTTPANGTSVKALPSISGTSSDNAGGSGIGKVNAYLRRTVNGAYQYWANRSGTWGWGASSTAIPTTLASTGVWSVSNTSPAGTTLPSGEKLPSGSYQVFANALDKAGNAKISAINTFSIDLTVPATVVVTSPANATKISSPPSIGGTSSDNAGGGGIGKVDAYLRRTVSGAYQYWANRSGVWDWGASVTAIPTTLATTGAWSVSNTSPAGTTLPSGAKLPTGSYQVFANALDKAGNSKVSVVNTFSVSVATTEPAPTAEPTESSASSVILSSSSAQASNGTVRLVFSGTLEINAASDPSRYSVTIDGVKVAIESVQVANSSTVVLTLEEGSVTAGDVAVVDYSIRDSKGLLLNGQAKVTVK